VAGAAFGNFSLLLAYNLQILSANGKRALAAEEIYQTLLSNRKPGHIDNIRAAHIIMPTSFHIYKKNYIKCSITLKEHLNFLTRLLFNLIIPYLSTKALHHLLTQSLYVNTTF
jgi:hypothetical protein